MVEEWINKRNEEVDLEKETNERRLTEIRYGLLWRILGLIAIIAFVIFRFSACANIMGRYKCLREGLLALNSGVRRL